MTTSTSRRSSSDPHRDTRFLTAVQSGGVVHVRCSRRLDGDFHRTAVPVRQLEPRRRRFVDLPWTMLDQHHGVAVREIMAPGDHDGSSGDVAATGLDDAVLGCWVGDCAPVVLIGAHRRFAVIHAGWRGLAAGVLDVAADALGEPVDTVVMGPAIGPCCHEFGVHDLLAVARGVGADPASITGTTSRGTMALDLEAAVRAFVSHRGHSFARLGSCTGCSYPGFSHRARRDPQRHVLAAWRTSPAQVGDGGSR